MRTKPTTTCLLLLPLAWLLPHDLHAQAPRVQLELEAGPAWQSYNDVEIPNDGSATRFSLSDIAGSGPGAAIRLYATWRVAERHGIRLLLAPLTLTGRGPTDRALDFAGARYASDDSVDATYTFNSYRVSYRWLARETESFTGWVGLTAKVRDATIALSQGGTSSRKDDLGFVPLLHLAGQWKLGRAWSLGLDVDGLAGGPGRAVDASLKLGYDLSDAWSVRVGYRTLEGGADVEEVYAFAWLHYAAASVVWRW